MSLRAVVVVLALSVLASCGEPFTYSAGAGGAGASGTGTGGTGSAGTGGAGTGSTMTSLSASTSVSVSSSSSAGGACTWKKNAESTCGPGAYCDTMSCSDGTCAPAPAETFDYAPACGCDGVTYWNESTAFVAATPLLHGGVCSDGEAKKCTENTDCPSGRVCSHDLTKNALGCASPEAGGACVGLPSTCEGTMLRGQQCGMIACSNACKLLANGARWTTASCN